VLAAAQFVKLFLISVHLLRLVEPISLQGYVNFFVLVDLHFLKLVVEFLRMVALLSVLNLLAERFAFTSAVFKRLM